MEKSNRQLDLNIGLGEKVGAGNGNVVFRAMETKERPGKRPHGEDSLSFAFASMHREHEHFLRVNKRFTEKNQ